MPRAHLTTILQGSALLRLKPCSYMRIRSQIHELTLRSAASRWLFVI